MLSFPPFAMGTHDFEIWSCDLFTANIAAPDGIGDEKISYHAFFVLDKLDEHDITPYSPNIKATYDSSLCIYIERQEDRYDIEQKPYKRKHRHTSSSPWRISF